MFHVRSSGIWTGEDAKLIQFEEAEEGFGMYLARRKFAYGRCAHPPLANPFPEERWTLQQIASTPWNWPFLPSFLSSLLRHPWRPFFSSPFVIARPRVINQIIRWVRLDFCLATLEFTSSGFDEGKAAVETFALPVFHATTPFPTHLCVPRCCLAMVLVLLHYEVQH